MRLHSTDSSAFGLAFENIATGGDMHLGTAEYYDIPTLSLRNIFLPRILENADDAKKVFSKDRKETRDDLEVYDLRHVGEWTHRIAGNLTAAYIDMQLCEMDRIEAAAGHSRIEELYPLPRLPRQAFNDRFEVGKTLPTFRPNCFTMNGQKNRLLPSKNEGWREWFHPDVPSKVSERREGVLWGMDEKSEREVVRTASSWRTNVSVGRCESGHLIGVAVI